MNDINDLFKCSVDKIICDRNIKISDYSMIFLYFPSNIIKHIVGNNFYKIQKFNKYKESSVIYETYFLNEYTFNTKYCHLYSSRTVFNTLNDTYTCEKCKDYRDKKCLIIQISEKEFCHYFNFLFKNIVLK